MAIDKQKPFVVRIAVYSFLIACITGIIHQMYIHFIKRNEIGLGSILDMIIPDIFVLILIQQIINGKNWSRILYVVLFVSFSIFPLFHDVYYGYAYSESGLVTTIVQFVSNVIGIFYIFSKEYNAWFRQNTTYCGLTTGLS
jgi:hypothetical protein